jgi:uncharacterized membrane protein YgdD (TMEM256/DUF423 family)
MRNSSLAVPPYNQYGRRRQSHILQLGIKARQFVFDGVQRFQHLASQEELGPQLCLAYGQHAANPLYRHSPDIFGRRRLSAFAQGREPRRGAAVVAGWSFAGGIVLFSGSLFVLALTGVERFSWATPVGGAALMLGWTALGLLALRRR